MKITRVNYFETYKKADESKLPKAIVETHALISEASKAGTNWSFFDEDKEMDEVLEIQFEKLAKSIETKSGSNTGKKSDTGSKKTTGKKTGGSYTNLKVRIQPKSPNSKLYIVWDIAKKQKFANEDFKSVAKAKAFVAQNKMTLVEIKENTSKSKSTKISTRKNTATAPDVKFVENIDVEIQFIKKYANLHGKEKTKMQISNLLKQLQKAITTKQIRSKSRFAKEIDTIQTELIKLLGIFDEFNYDTITVTIKDVEKYKAIGNSEKRLLSVTYILRFIALTQKPDVVEKAERLSGQITKAIEAGKVTKSDKYFEKLEMVNRKLKSYIKESGTLELSKAQLNGLNGFVKNEIQSIEGLNGLNGAGAYAAGFLSSLASRYIYDRYVKPKAGTQGQNNTAGNNTKAKIVNSMVLKDMRFDTIRLAPEFDKMIGELTPGASIMIYGGPGSGKSTLAVLFAKSLAGYNGKRVLIITDEEGITLTSQDKFDRSNAFHKNIDVTDDIPQDSILNEYDVVVFDSVQSLKITPNDMETFNEKHPQVIKLYILQVTKEGKFKGEKEFEHIVDTVLHAENGVISSVGEKNRFGARGEIRVYEEE